MDFKRIIITGDTRRSTTCQHGNILRFYWTLREQLKHITGITPEVYITEDRLPDEDWYELYNPHNSDRTPWLAEQTDLKDCLVLSWEQPYNDIAWFKNNNIKNIDFLTYPTCMYSGLGGSDPVYGVSVTKDYMLYPDILTDHDFQVRANHHKAQYYRKARIGIPDKVAVIIGQTPIDRSLIDDNGKIITLMDYEKEITEIVSSHSGTIFRPHPHAWKRSKEGHEFDIPMFMVGLGCAMWDEVAKSQPPTQEPWSIYDLLSEPKITTIAGISSSCIYEAKFFEKETTRFDKRYYNHVFGQYVPVMWKDIQQDIWWKQVLCPEDLLNAQAEIGGNLNANKQIQESAKGLGC